MEMFGKTPCDLEWVLVIDHHRHWGVLVVRWFNSVFFLCVTGRWGIFGRFFRSLGTGHEELDWFRPSKNVSTHTSRRAAKTHLLKCFFLAWLIFALHGVISLSVGEMYFGFLWQASQLCVTSSQN